ncbi:MAG: hypothetical protein K2J72_06085 [Oscillospiraceae bacterium]|nr:hypothetical protein [Oscillospiraceae bacterium]
MKTVHRTVFKIYFYANRNKEGRSCSPLLETALAVSHLLLRFGGYAPAGAGKGISRSAERDQGLCPVDLATFEKVDETFPCGFAARRLLDSAWCAKSKFITLQQTERLPKFSAAFIIV